MLSVNYGKRVQIRKGSDKVNALEAELIKAALNSVLFEICGVVGALDW